MTARELIEQLEGVRKSGAGWTARCPAHDDKHASLSINEGSDGKPLLFCHAGCTFDKVMAAIRYKSRNGNRTIVAEYDYRDEHGNLLYQSVRFAPKDFRVRRPDGLGDWEWNLNGTSRVLYCLPELQRADPDRTVLIVEGEKDADNLIKTGLIATTNVGGAGKWRAEYKEALRGRKVVILPDNDEPGKKHAQQVAEALLGIAASVKILALTGLPEKGDVSDWLHAGGTVEELRSLAESAAIFQAATKATEPKAGRRSQATHIVALADDVDLFHTPDGEAYATIEVENHYETWPLASRGFRDYLTRKFYRSLAKAPSAQAMKEALAVLSPRARFDGETREVHTRIAEHDGILYIDLADATWRIVSISAHGWEVTDNGKGDVRFRRPRGMLALPEPRRGGSIDSVRWFVNVTDDDWSLLKGWILACYRPNKPFPVLAFNGEQGTAKTTTARITRSLVDPNVAAMRSEPRDERDLVIAARNGWIISLDNLSHLPSWLSDAICRLATGGGFGTRELYTDSDEILFDSMRPVMINGIEELARRGDLLDRSILATLPRIAEDKRRPEGELWSEFERERPVILGAFLDAVSAALSNGSAVQLDSLPRMADFALWVTAGEPALGLRKGEFMTAYQRNRQSANDLALESSGVAETITHFIKAQESMSWTGLSADLLLALNECASDELKRERTWPKSPQALGGILTRLAPNLRASGWKIERGIGRQRRRWSFRLVEPAGWRVETAGKSLSPMSRSSQLRCHGTAGADGQAILSPNLSSTNVVKHDVDDNRYNRDNQIRDCSDELLPGLPVTNPRESIDFDV